MAWNPNTEPVDYAELGGQRTPGICEVIGANSPRQWDEGRGPGLSGARLRFRGQRLSRFMLRLSLTSDQDFADWEAFKPTVQPPRPDVEAFNRAVERGERPGGLVDLRRRALDIVHPITEDVGIRSVVVEDVSGLQQTDNGVWTVEIKVIEYRPPVRAAVLINGSSHQTSADPRDLEIGALERELRFRLGAEELENSR